MRANEKEGVGQRIRREEVVKRKGKGTKNDLCGEFREA
jgi:hypothetical protein